MLFCFVSQDEEGKGKKSILDVDPEVQAIMEMTGKTLHSQGLREPEEDQMQWEEDRLKLSYHVEAPSSSGTLWNQTAISLPPILLVLLNKQTAPSLKATWHYSHSHVFTNEMLIIVDNNSYCVRYHHNISQAKTTSLFLSF